MIYSTTIRSVGEINNFNNFKKGMEIIKKSKFTNGNLNFFEIQDLLDDNFDKENILEKYLNSDIVFNISHAPFYFPMFF